MQDRVFPGDGSRIRKRTFRFQDLGCSLFLGQVCGLPKQSYDGLAVVSMVWPNVINNSGNELQANVFRWSLSSSASLIRLTAARLSVKPLPALVLERADAGCPLMFRSMMTSLILISAGKTCVSAVTLTSRCPNKSVRSQEF